MIGLLTILVSVTLLTRLFGATFSLIDTLHPEALVFARKYPIWTSVTAIGTLVYLLV